MPDSDYDEIPVSTLVPSSAHPAYLRTGRDDLPTRTGKKALAELYTAYVGIETTLGQLADKAKARTYLQKETTRTVDRALATIKHLRGQEKTFTESIRNNIGKLSNTFGTELRQHFKQQKNPFATMLKEINDPAVARAVYGVPNVLLGITTEQAAILQDRIESIHVPEDYMHRESTRKAAEVLDNATAAFSDKQHKRQQIFAKSDEVILEAAAAKKTEAA